MAERRGQYPQGEAGEAASVTAVREYAHEEPADVTGSFVLHEPPWYGTVCPVVWEDGGSNPASYPMGVEVTAYGPSITSCPNGYRHTYKMHWMRARLQQP